MAQEDTESTENTGVVGDTEIETARTLQLLRSQRQLSSHQQVLFQNLADDALLDESEKSEEDPVGGKVSEISGNIPATKTGDKTCHLCLLNLLGMFE